MRYLLTSNGDVLPFGMSDSEDLSYNRYRQKGATEVQVVPLDAITIRRDELPEVRKHGREGMDYRVEFQDGGPGGGIYADEPTAEGAWRNAVAWAGIAAYLREHPPVDERRVDEIQDVIIEVGTESTRELARRIAERFAVATSDG